MKSPSTLILNKTQSAFTLVEVIVTLGIFAIIAAIGLFFSMDGYRSYVFNNERNLAVSVLQKARSRAIANIGQQPHGVHIDLAGNQYVIFEGVYNAASTNNINVPFNSSSINHNGLTEVIFNQLDGSITSVPSALDLSDSGLHSSIINFNSEGQIIWTN